MPDVPEDHPPHRAAPAGRLKLLEGDAAPHGTSRLAAWAFERWGSQVLGFLRRLVGDEHEAEALAQEVFCRLLEAGGAFENSAMIRGWLFRVARNLALDHGKKRKPQLLTPASSEGGDPLDEFAGTRDTGSDEREYCRRMHAALERIPDLYRSTLVMRFLEEWSYERIAALEGVSESALRTRVQKGLQLLRGALGLPEPRTRTADRRSNTASR